MGLPAISSEELVSLLHRAGARIISRQPHGVLLKVRQRLVFIPWTTRVSDPTLADVLRTAAITPEQLVALRVAFLEPH